MIESSIFRVLNAKSKTVGTGFLVSKTLAVTCAHVVFQVGADTGMCVRIQFTGQKKVIEASVQVNDLDHDVAILQLDEIPAGIDPLRLGCASESRLNHPLYTFGYASAVGEQGIGGSGHFVRADGNFVQFRMHEADHGHSGAPLFDQKRQVVIGMIAKGKDQTGRNAETTFAIPSDLIFDLRPEIRPAETCPYLGLDTFTAETARFFFGRESLTEKLVAALRGGCRFLAVFGPSGSGKSSVVRAGLLPRLADGLFSDWRQIVLRPADDPFSQLQAAGLESLESLSECAIVLVDQFEELFTLCPDEIRERFVKGLVAALERPRFLLVISMRDDFYSAFNAKAVLLAQSEHLKIENVPGVIQRDELLAMMERPAELTGLALEDGLAELILSDLTHDGVARSSALPLLEFAMTQLWQKRRDGRLTREAYQSIGGVAGSLARWADEAYSDLPKSDQSLAERLLTSLVHLGDEAQGLPDTRKRRPLTDFDELTQQVIKHFADRRLLVTDGETVELMHDALVREWGRLQGWLKKDRAQLRMIEAISEAANAWNTAPKNTDLLVHRGGRLEDALKLWRRLNAKEQAYLKICVKEKRNRERIRKWIIAGISGATFILFCMITAIAVIAVWGWKTSIENGNMRLATQLETASLSNQNYFDLATLLKLENLQISDTLKGRGDLLSLLQTHPHLRQYLRGSTGDITGITFSPDENTLISINSSTNDALMFWNARTGKLLATLPGKGAGYTSLAMSPDGRILATANTNIFLWDVEKHQLQGTLIQEMPGRAITSLAFSPDGKTLAAGDSDSTRQTGGVITRWDVDRRQQIGEPLTGHGDAIWSLAFSPDGKWLASGSWDHTVRLWDAVTGQPSGEPLKGHTNSVSAVVFTPDSQALVSCGVDKTIRVWDVALRQLQGEPVFMDDSCWSLAFNGQILAAGGGKNIWFWNADRHTTTWQSTHSVDSTLTWLWDTESHSLTGELLTGHRNRVSGLALSRDGKTLASSSDDGNIILWGTVPSAFSQTLPVSGSQVAFSPARQLLAISKGNKVTLLNIANNQPRGELLFNQANMISDLDFSPDGQTLAAAYENKTIMLWDVVNMRPRGESLKKHKLAVTTLAFNPIRNILASGSKDKNIVLWDSTTGQPLGEPLTGHTDWINSLVFSHDGKMLASSDFGGNVFLWDGTTGKHFESIPIEQYALSLAFSPDNKILAIGTIDGKIVLWDVEKQQQKGSPLTGHTDAVTALIFSSDTGSTLLFSGSTDTTVRLWDVSTGQPLGLPFEGNTSVISNLAIGRNLKGQLFLASSDNDEKVILWNVDFNSWRTKACSIAGRNLTETEWKQYVGDTKPEWGQLFGITKPYQKTCLP